LLELGDALLKLDCLYRPPLRFEDAGYGGRLVRRDVAFAMAPMVAACALRRSAAVSIAGSLR
jgi:hypothetical protein